MRRISARGGRVVATLVILVGLAAPALAGHWYINGWRDRHWNYPRKPYGYREIVDTFGQPCSDRARANAFWWKAHDNGVWYEVRFHRKLGGSVSTNLDNDVRGHIGNQHLDPYVKSGIWGYNCRFIDGTNKYSTHAWGIAVDVSAVYEPLGQCHSTVNYHHDQIWRDHRWTWGKQWCDPMHFQFASGY